ncbi:MAG: ATP-binding protein [Oligoflexia bacterium]|nr:ATP-binding protein [Oligoflexia bacterium]
MKMLPIGIQSFEKLIEMNCIYVDKTKFLYNLIKSGTTYFLSRPRRFGKSLTISTLEAIFLNKRELFKGLWIDQSDYDWKLHPVIRLDMSLISNFIGDDINPILINQLERIAKFYQIEFKKETNAQICFDNLIFDLYSKLGRVVILIDEYDKPILDHISNRVNAETNREFLKNFYGVMKALDANIRFIFLTGVTKFSKVSVFSGLNNLTDITMSSNQAGMLGYTEEELLHYFHQYIEEFSKDKEIPLEVLVSEIRTWYNGFRFSEDEVKVYNPFSTLLLFKEKRFRNYWFETGTPKFLMELIKEREFNLLDAEDKTVEEYSFSSFEVSDISIYPLLYQTGYFTIKEYYPEDRRYRLGYPNKEIEIAFNKHIIAIYSQKSIDDVDSDAGKIHSALRERDLVRFFEVLRVLLASISYQIKIKDEEKHYQFFFYTVLRCIGVNVQVEVTTNKGRIDVVINMSAIIYILELKLTGTAQQALKQIKEKGYYEKYLLEGKQIVLVGVSIDKKKRNFGKWTSEILNTKRMTKTKTSKSKKSED